MNKEENRSKNINVKERMIRMKMKLSNANEEENEKKNINAEEKVMI